MLRNGTGDGIYGSALRRCMIKVISVTSNFIFNVYIFLTFCIFNIIMHYLF